METSIALSASVSVQYEHFCIKESIPVGCLPIVYQPYVLQWPPDVSTSGGGGFQVNKFNRFPVLATRCC